MFYETHKRFEELHGGIRALLVCALAVLSAAATAGEVSSLSDSRLVDQLGVLQSTFGEVATSVGLPVPPSLTLPINVPPPSSSSAAPSAAPTDNAPSDSKASGSDTNAVAKADVSSVPAPQPSARVGEYNAALPAGSTNDASDPLASTGSINLPGASNLGNFNQVVGALQPLAGESDAVAFVKPVGGFGAGSIIAPPPSAQSSLTRGAPDRDSLSGMAASAARSQFGDRGDFTVGSGSKTPAAAAAEREKLAEEKAALDQEQKQKEEQDKKDKKLTDEELKGKLTELVNKPPPLTFQDYEAMRDLVNDEPRRVSSMGQQDPKIFEKAQTLLSKFGPDDTQELDKKNNLRSFLVDSQRKSAIDDFAQGPDANDRTNIERNTRPSGSQTTH